MGVCRLFVVLEGALPVVRTTITDPSGTPIPDALVRIRVVTSTSGNGHGYDPAADSLIHNPEFVRSDAAGLVSVTLKANVLVKPDNSYYEWVVFANAIEADPEYIVVPNTAGPFDLYDILVTPPSALTTIHESAYDHAAFPTDAEIAATVAAAVAAHSTDTTSQHGITDFAQVAIRNVANTFTAALTVLANLIVRGPIPHINVRAHGATGDGVTNDTTTFLAALNAVPAIGARVYAPAGTYLVNANVLAALSNTELYGDGKDVTIIKLANGQAGNVLNINAKSNVRVRDLTLDGNRAAATPTYSVYLNATSKVRLERVRMTNGNTCVFYDGSNTDLKILDCDMEEMIGSGINGNGAGASLTRFRIERNYITTTDGSRDSGAGIHVLDGVDGWVVNNHLDGVSAQFLNMMTFRFPRKVRILGNFSARGRDDCCTVYAGSEDIVIANNILIESIGGGVSNGTTGVYMYNASVNDPLHLRPIIANNQCRNNPLAGLRLSDVRDAKVVGNTCHQNGRFGIMVTEGINAAADPADCTLVGNTCTSNDEAGIEVDNAEGILLEGNICKNNGVDAGAAVAYRSGIIIGPSANRCSLIGNRCTDDGAQGSKTQKVGIALNGSLVANNLVEGNHIANNGRHGIYLASTNNNHIQGNYLYGNGSDTNNTYGQLVCGSGANDYNTIKSNTFRKGAYSNLPSYAILAQSGVGDNNVIEDNDLYDSAGVSTLIVVTQTNTTVRRNRGYKTEASGTAKLLAANTSIVVTHGLRSAPTRVVLTPTTDPLVRLWVSAKGATTFTVTASGAPGTDVDFDWRAIVGDD